MKQEEMPSGTLKRWDEPIRPNRLSRSSNRYDIGTVMKKTHIVAAAMGILGSAVVAQTVDICVESAYPLFSYTTTSGDVEGFDNDITNALCYEMVATCEIVKTDWDGIIPALIEGKCDAIIASMSITEERKQAIDFSAKYYQTPAIFAAAEGITMEMLPGKTVGVQRRTIHQDFMEGEFPDIILKLYGSQDEAYLDLTSGRID